jgi:hypothetical protein
MLRVSEQTSGAECSVYGNSTDTAEDLVSPILLFELQKKCLVILFDNRFPRVFVAMTSLKVERGTVIIPRNSMHAYYYYYCNNFLQKCNSMVSPCK